MRIWLNQIDIRINWERSTQKGACAKSISMQFIFFRGPFILSDGQGDLFNKSKYSIKPVLNPNVTEIDDEDNVWIPNNYLHHRFQYMNIFIDTEKQYIIGYYIGEVFRDTQKRIFSSHSYITLRPDYRNKRLCTPFAENTYLTVIKEMKAEYFIIYNQAVNKENANRSYVRAALNGCFLVYGFIVTEGIEAQRQLLHVDDLDDCGDEINVLLLIVPQLCKKNEPDSEMLNMVENVVI